jgi:hypothetical protein
VDFRSFLEDVTKIPRTLSSLETRIFMQDQYEIRTGIFDHVTNGAERPLSSVAMFPSEDFTSNGKTYDILQKYAQGNYREIWGLSIEEYLQLPQWKTRMMEKIADEILKKKTKALDAEIGKVQGKP